MLYADLRFERAVAKFGQLDRILASVADAEDILQDTWLKWSAVDANCLDQPRAYLARTVTNLSINRLKSATVQRESYVGPWLPEPLVMTGDADRRAEQAEAISLAMLVVLETLSPLERAVFVLVNGQPGLLVTSAGVPDNVVVIDPGPDDRISAIRLIRNPDKLAHLVSWQSPRTPLAYFGDAPWHAAAGDAHPGRPPGRAQRRPRT